MKKEINYNQPISGILMNVWAKLGKGEIWEELVSLIGKMLYVGDIKTTRGYLIIQAEKQENIGKKDLYMKCINACDNRIKELQERV